MSRFVSKKWIAHTFAAVVLLSFTVALAVAQTTTGNLQGVVSDPNKANVTGAKVKVTNADTGIVRETTTNDEGFYRVTNLIPGEHYKVEVTAQSFAPRTVDNVVVRLATENTADVQLELTGASATVEVTAESPLIQGTQSQLSQVYTPKQLTQLPFNGLLDNLALLTPGVVTPGDADFTNGVGISANGNRARSNNFQIDGQDNNDNSVAGPSTFITNSEAIGEYQVITNTFSAEFGRNSGAQINLITKPGTNSFHGTFFEYHRNSALNARDNIEKRAQQTFQFMGANPLAANSAVFASLGNRFENPQPFRENRFGGSLGGPIKHDKAFFFLTYQGTYFRGEGETDNLTSASLTPTLADATFLNTRFANATTGALISTAIGGGPAAVTGLGTFICAPPTIDTNGDAIPDQFQFGPGNVFGQPTTPGFLAPIAVVDNGAGGRRVISGCEGVRIYKSDATNHQIIGRVDWNLSNKYQLNTRYIYDHDENPAPATGRFLAGAAFGVPSRTNNFGISLTRLGSKWTNEARFNFSRLNVTFGDTSTRPGPEISFGSSQRDLFFNFGLTFGTQNNLPQSRKVDVYQYQDTMSSTIGNHALKFGADIRQQKVSNFFLPNFLGRYQFRSGGALPANTFFNYGTTGLNGSARTTATSFENFVLNRPAIINFALGNPLIKTDQNDFFFFVQDDWRVRPTLTLNLGLRYEVSTQPLNPIIQASNEREANNATAIFNTSFPLSTRTATKIPTDKNNFAPRVGFAWSPNLNFLGDRFTNGRTVFRGNFGISYDPSFFNIVLNTVTAAPFAASGTVQTTPFIPGIAFPFLPTTTAQLNTTPGTNGGDPRLFNQTRVSSDFHNPYAISYGFGVQQELVKNTVLEARYVGTQLRGQFQTLNANPDIRFLLAAGNAIGNLTAFTNGIGPVSCVASGDPTCIAPTTANGWATRTSAASLGSGRLNPFQGATRIRVNGASSTYNGLQMELRTRFYQSLALTANYTFSKTLDNASEIFGTLAGGQAVASPQNPFNSTSGERGLSAFDQRHTFTSNFLYELPFYKEQRGAVGHLLGGWQLNGIIRLGSGRPYTPVEALSTVDAGFENTFTNGLLRPFNGNTSLPNGTIAFGYQAACSILFGGPYCDYNGGALDPGEFVVFNTLSPGTTGTVVSAANVRSQARLIYNDLGLLQFFGSTFDPRQLEAFNLFRTPFGDVGRNTLSGLPSYNLDFSVFKTTKLTENTKLEFRAEFFNILNHRNFGVPDAITEDAATGFTVSSFQNPGFNQGSNRSMRLGLRFIF